MTGAGQDQEESVAPLPGNTPAGFGRYQVFASLGRGGMADVFLAVARGPMGFNKLVVIKRLRPALAQEEGFREMFLDEARLAARLNHPNVIHTYEVGESQGSFYIAMEYLEGQPLNKIIGESLRQAPGANDAFDPVFCARIIADACNGLHHAHELRDYDGRPLQIIHRDVSPHNVFVTYDGQVKLVDFGIAKAALSSTETEVGVLKGKVAYMAPEQAMGGRIDARADIFAMGIVLWELVARKRLMAGENAANTLHRLMNEPVPTLTSAVPNVDPRMNAIVMRALEKEPDKRYSSAREMRDALEAFIADSGQTMRQEEVGRRIALTFAKTREQIQREVQRHMTALSSPPSSPSARVKSLSLSSMDQIENAGGNLSAELLNLGESTPGMVSAGVRDPRSGSGSTQTAAAGVDTGRQRVKLAAVLLVFLGLVGIIIVLLLGRMRRDEAAPIASATALPSAAASTGIGSAGAASATDGSFSAPPSSAPPSTASSAITGDAPSANAAASAPSAAPIAASPATPSTPATPRGGARTTHTPSGRTPPPPRPPPSPAAAAANDGPPGFLTFDTYPWTKVSENGRSLGTTPIVRASMSPGTHVLQLENGEAGIKQTYTVTIKSGEAVSKRLGLK